MITIWKYELSKLGVNEVEMPANSEVRHVGSIMNFLYIWCEVNTNDPIAKEQFYVVGTGREIPKNIRTAISYIGTAITDDGFVWHVYWNAYRFANDLKVLELANAVEKQSNA